MGLQMLDVAKTKDRVAPASRFALSEYNKIGLSAKAKTPDVALLEKLQAKNKADVEFLLGYDGKTIVFYAKCGSTKLPPYASLSLASAGRPGVQRAIIQALVTHSVAADKSDLDKFNKLHPPPPTPEEEAKLARAIAPLRMQMRDAIAAAKKAADDLKAAQAKIKPLEDLEKEFKKRSDAD